MKVLQNTLFPASFILFLAACIGSSSGNVNWTAGTWTESDFAAASNNYNDTGLSNDDCGLVPVLNALDSPLQYTLGPKSEETGSSTYSNNYDGLSDENIADAQDNLWNICNEPRSYRPDVYCGFYLHLLSKPTWKPTLKDQFCPESTGMSFSSGTSKGLLLNENEIFFVHRVDLTCGVDKELACSSRYVSRLRPSGSD